ncbi:hypothetical protein [Murimonas intestini]|uniref:NAD-dependent epimerase/dehydratase family protein n=1 Tax=Murimonas intestini TaxID=1337051 RepID=A0AB73T4Y7_9FIRM|nr:hypothetical protein [Murimonas intestini]MCR1840678.1 hypothetical protein [Murimonas intestini]MCR1865269.1 hypothetical protein [Murimonas intestini]MCR1883033.1 hypothetical protein [Murimonas intestini]
MNLHKSNTYINDLDVTVSHVVGLKKLKNMTILITGVTGTVGSYITDTLVRLNYQAKYSMTIILAGRNPEKINSIFADFKDGVETIQYNLNAPIQFDFDVDFIIHATRNAHVLAIHHNMA